MCHPERVKDDTMLNRLGAAIQRLNSSMRAFLAKSYSVFTAPDFNAASATALKHFLQRESSILGRCNESKVKMGSLG